MSSLSSSVLDIQSILAASTCIADVRVSHVEDDDGAESIRLAYTVGGSDDIDASERLFAEIEKRHGLAMARSGSSGDGLFIIWRSVMS